MIEDKETKMKFAESPREAMLSTALEHSEKRLREMELSVELETVVQQYLRRKVAAINNQNKE